MLNFVNANTVIASVILLFLILALIAAIVGMYNRLVLLKNNIAKAYANIDVLLLQRVDEVPNLVAIVKGSQQHEQTLLKELVALRAKFLDSGDPDKKIRLSNAMQTQWKSTVAVIESYPDLKAGKAFLALQHRMTELENHLADRREFFNESVTLYNISIAKFPTIIMAVMVGYRGKSLLNQLPADSKR
jgi:LemA protein